MCISNGAIASANLFSLIETAKAHDHRPYNYLNYVFTELALAKTPEQLQALLPYHIANDEELPHKYRDHILSGDWQIIENAISNQTGYCSIKRQKTVDSF
jgi:hypothetical protein